MLSIIVKYLNISRYFEPISVTENMTEPTLKAILKYRKHRGIIEIQNQFEIKNVSLYRVDTDDAKMKYSN